MEDARIWEQYKIELSAWFNGRMEYNRLNSSQLALLLLEWDGEST